MGRSKAGHAVTNLLLLLLIAGLYLGTTQPQTISVSAPGRTRNRRGGYTQSEPGYSYSSTRTPVLSDADITGIPIGRGLYWSPRGWELLTMNPWWQQRSAYGL